MRLTEENIETLLAECDATPAKTRVSDDDAKEFRATIRQLLYDYRSAIGENRDVHHRVRRRLDRVELLLFVHGERLDPFEIGEGAFERSVKRKLSIFPFGRGTTIGYLYGLFIRNASAAYCMAYRLLEELEAAKVMGAVDGERLRVLEQ